MDGFQVLERDGASYARFIEALRGARLPTDDLDGEARFHVLRAGGFEVFGGLEGSGPDQLIRSILVPAAARGQGHGRQIVEDLARQARQDGAERLWLLTASADRFFAGLGWTSVDRASAPATVRASRQFTGLCPASAALMCRRLA